MRSEETFLKNIELRHQISLSLLYLIVCRSFYFLENGFVNWSQKEKN